MKLAFQIKRDGWDSDFCRVRGEYNSNGRSRVLCLQHYCFQGFTSRVPRDYCWEVPSGLTKGDQRDRHGGWPLPKDCTQLRYTASHMEFLPEEPGTGFLHKKRVPGLFYCSEAGPPAVFHSLPLLVPITRGYPSPERSGPRQVLRPCPVWAARRSLSRTSGSAPSLHRGYEPLRRTWLWKVHPSPAQYA